MNSQKLALKVLLLSFVMFSCSSEQENLTVETSSKLLNSFTLSKVNGTYSLDYITNNASSNVVKNNTSNSNDIFLYSEESNITQNNFSESFKIDNNTLQLNFIDTKYKNNPSITIMDDNIVLAKGEDNGPMLNSYNVTSTDNGTYDLDFTVRNNVEVEFVYNEEIETYEVHLERKTKKVSSKDYTRNLTPINGFLRIDFVNHLSAASKGYAYREAESLTKKKPRVIIITDFTGE